MLLDYTYPKVFRAVEVEKHPFRRQLAPLVVYQRERDFNTLVPKRVHRKYLDEQQAEAAI